MRRERTEDLGRGARRLDDRGRRRARGTARATTPAALALVMAGTMASPASAARLRVAGPVSPPSAAAAPANRSDNLLKNGELEDGGRNPAAWTRGQPVPGVEYGYDRRGGVDGSGALSLRKTVERYFPIAEWRQEFAHDDGTSRLHVGALVRAEEAYKAVVDVQFVDADGAFTHAWAGYVGARAAGDPPATHDWMWYSGVVAIPEGAETLRVGLQIYGPGEVWFDRVLARYVPDDVAPTDAGSLAAQAPDRWGTLPPTDGAAAGGEEWARPSVEVALRDDPRRRYFRIDPPEGAKLPRRGAGLLLVVPGGDGSAEFHPFVRRIAENAAPDDMIVVQAVAPVWRDDDDRVVWPLENLPDPKAEFTTESFLLDIVADVKAHTRIDDDRIFALGWSSGGPPCYALSVRKKTPLRGAFVAMSVFRPEWMPPLQGARKQAYYLFHSPDDFIAMSHPEQARVELERQGARVTLQTYEGGHGWHGDVYGELRRGLAWLEDR